MYVNRKAFSNNSQSEFTNPTHHELKISAIIMGPHVHFFLSVLGPHVWRPSVHTVTLWVHIWISPVVPGRYCFPWSHVSPLIFMSPLLYWSLSLMGRSLTTKPFRTEYSKVSHSLYIVQLWVSLLIPIYCSKKLTWCSLREALIYGFIIMSLRDYVPSTE